MTSKFPGVAPDLIDRIEKLSITGLDEQEILIEGSAAFEKSLRDKRLVAISEIILIVDALSRHNPIKNEVALTGLTDALVDLGVTAQEYLDATLALVYVTGPNFDGVGSHGETAVAREAEYRLTGK